MEDYIAIALPIVAVILVVVTTFWTKWANTKALLKELAEALTALSEAIADNDVTQKEIDKLLSEFKDVIKAAAKLVGK